MAGKGGAASIDPEKLRQEIRAGVRLRHVETVDKSKPFIKAEGETLQIRRLPVLSSPSTSHYTPSPPPPPPIARPILAPPPPPPASLSRNSSAPAFVQTKPSLQPGDRDRLLNEIKQGRRLRHVETVDKSKPVVRVEPGFEDSTPSPVFFTGNQPEYRDEYDRPDSGYNHSPSYSNGYNEPAYQEEVYHQEFAPIGETGFIPSYGRLPAYAPPPPPPPPPMNGHGQERKLSSASIASDKPKAHAGFYTEAPPPAPSNNPLVDESSFSVDNMVNVFNQVLTKAEEEEARRRNTKPRGRINTAAFETSRSKSLSNLQQQQQPVNGSYHYQQPVRNGRKNSSDESDPDYHVTPSGSRYRRRSQSRRWDDSSADRAPQVTRPDSPPSFRPESFPMPESFRSEELVANRFVNPVLAERTSARDEIAAIEARHRQASTLPPPSRMRVVSTAPRVHPAPVRRPPEQTYAHMAQPQSRPVNYPSQTPARSARDNNYTSTSSRTYLYQPPAPFVPEELIANHYVPSSFSNDYPLPELTPASHHVITEAQTALNPGVVAPRGNRGEMERAFAEAVIRRNEGDAHMEVGRTDYRPEEDIGRLIKPGSSRALASQFEEKSRSNSPSSFATRRSQSHHRLYQSFPAASEPDEDQSGRQSPVFASERGMFTQHSVPAPLKQALPSVASLKGTFERPAPIMARTVSESGSLGWRGEEEAGGVAGVPWQRLFREQRSKFLPDVARIADTYEELAAKRQQSAIRPRTPSVGRRVLNSGGESQSGSAEDSSSQGSSNGENRYPSAFLQEEESHYHPPSAAYPKAQPTMTMSGPVPWRVGKTGAPATIRTAHVGSGGFPESLVSPVREDVFALRDFHRAELEELRHTFSARLHRTLLHP